MQYQTIRPRPSPEDEHEYWLCELTGQHPGRRCAEAAYSAFCRERLPLYSQFASAATGSALAGQHLARAVLEGLAAQWLVALRSASPAAFAWALLTQAITPYRTDSVRTLYRGLRAGEADALLLRHRLGCSVAAGGRVMGMSPDAFELLRRQALANIASVRHMPVADAI
ncbi:hypothetical protein K7472_08040 [Streptomyces sp. PTM05]|uniref:Uncharacterized protein n=1 Tax=Streptantibioticus parmotrematis TaxID=2873249 RepID=A0ABS7QNN6_9ACTN|nr:hypothetical protein [Streptantibioticus parmotrematis]MBY8884795.1 hypothetical protein [Streptantibioticus parmotrematis]